MRKKKKAYIDNGFISANGVCFGNDIALQYSKPHESAYFGISRAIFALITSFAAMSMFASFILKTPDYGPIFLCCALPVLLMCVIKSKTTAIRAIGFVFLAVYFLYFMVHSVEVADGFLSSVYLYLERAKQPSGILGNSLNGIDRSMYPELARFFLQFLSSIISVIVTVSCVYRIDFPMLFIATFPLFELGMYWGWEAPLISVVVLIISWVVIISLHTINQRTNKAGKKNTFAVHEKKQTYYLTNEVEKSRMFFVLMRFIALLCAAMFLLIIVFSNLFGHKRSEGVNSLRSRINNFVNNFSLEDLGGLFADYDGGFDFFGTKTVGGTNGGRLGETEGISFNGTTALVVTTKPISETMYLRGYVAGNYKDNAWDPVEYDEKESFAKELDSVGIAPQDINYYKLTDLTNFLTANNIVNDYTVTEEIDVKVKGASKKYVYAPYGTLYSNGNSRKEYKMKPHFDSYFKLGSNNYSVTYRKPTTDYYGRIRNAIADKNVFYDVNSTIPSKTVEKYNKFVKANYSKVTNSEGLQAAYKEINEKYLSGIDRSYSSVIYAISSYFRDNYKYTLSPGKTPSGKDFVDYFLSEQKQGYCSYFASAGVQLMRKFGFQARYVEGYVVLPGMSETDSETIDIDVPDKCAHAWTEVYIEDFGWVSVEFTPGYVNDNPNMTDAEKNPSKKQTPPDESSSLSDSSSSPESSSQESSSNQDSTLSIADQSSSTADNSSSSDNDSSEVEDSSNNGGSDSSTNDSNSGGGIVITDSSGISSHDPNSGKPESKSDEPPHGISAGSTVIFIILFTVVFVGVMVLRRILSLKTLESNCLEGSTEDRIQHIMKYTIRYLKLIDVSGRENITDMQLYSELAQKLKAMDIDVSDKLKFIFETAEEAFMGNHEIPEDDVETAYSYMQEIANHTVKPKLDPIKRFRAMFVSCLY